MARNTLAAATLTASLIGAAAWLPACSSHRPARSDAVAAKPITASSKPGNAVETLASQAAREAAGRSKTPQAGSIETPPGVEPEALALRDPADPKPTMTFGQAVEEVAASIVRPAPPAASQPAATDDQSRLEAVKLYAKGRSAALDRRHMQAVLDLQKAVELDPESAPVIRELARAYAELNNTGRALEMYERLSRLEPDNTEAMFTMGLAAANRREFAAAIGALGPHRAAGRSFEHDAGADILADFTLSIALRELGYDRAAIEAARRVAELPDDFAGRTEHGARLASVYRQRGELWRTMGDAHCRLGEFAEALEAYERAAILPTTDPSALHPREVYANLSLGRPTSAQWTLYQALAANPQAASERDIRLCGYIAAHVRDPSQLAQALADLAIAHPEAGGVARAAASLLPDDKALGMLREFVGRRPRDLQAVRELLAWLAQRDAAQAIELATGLAVQQPDLFDAYAAALLSASPSAREVVEAMPRVTASAVQARLHARMLTKVDGLGEAWQVNDAALAQWPSDRGLLLQRVELAAALREPRLLDDAIADAEVAVADDVPGLIILAQAHRVMGRTDRAVEGAQRAVDADAKSIPALLELARARTARAIDLATGPDGQAAARAQVDLAIAGAEQALALDPGEEAAYEVLAMIHAPGGVLADTQTFRAVCQRLREAVPNSPLYARLAAQEAIAQRRFEMALERLVNLCENDPTDTTSLSLAITAWEQWGRLERAEQWLDGRLEARPGDPALVEQWTRVKLLRGQSAQAIERLEQRLGADGEDFFARRLLETVYRASGRVDDALKLGEQRLLSRPQGVRRETELAALYAGAERADKAIERLEWVKEHAAEAGEDDLGGALAIIGRLPEAEPRRDPLALELANAMVDRFPQAPLQAYGSALRALARTEGTSAAFDELARRAATQARGGSDGSLQTAINWRDLAQGLVDAEQPAAAAAALRVKLEATAEMDERAAAALTRMTLILDAAAEVRAAESGQPVEAHGERSLATLRQADEKGLVARVVDLEAGASFADACYEIGVFYSLLGAHHGVETLLQAAIAAEPDAAMTLNNLGYARLEQGRQDEQTIDLIERAHALQPQESNILDTLGWLRYKQGRFADADGTPGALTLIRQSLERSPEASAEVLDHLGDAHWRAGQASEAQQMWSRAVQMLEDQAFRDTTLQTFTQVQTRMWQIVVATPQQLYDRQYGKVLERARAKVEAVERGEAPAVEPTWEEGLKPG